MPRILPRLIALTPALTLGGFLLTGGAHGMEAGDLVPLVGVAGLALVFVLAAIERAAGSRAWLGACVAVSASVLLVPLAQTLAADTTAVAAFDPARLDRVASLATTGAWALLLASGLVAGLALGLATIAARRRRPGAAAMAFVAALVTVPIPLIVVWSSPGIGLLFSAMRWGPVAFAMIAVVVASTAQPDERAATHVYAVFPAVASFGVLSAFAFIELPVLEMASSVHVFSHRGLLIASTSREVVAFGWRLPLVPLVSLLPLLVLGDRPLRQRLAALATVGAVLLACALPYAWTSEALGAVARAAAFDETRGALVVDGHETPATVRAHAAAGTLIAVVDPERDAPLGPLVRAARSEDVRLVLVTRADTPEVRELFQTLEIVAPHAARELEAERLFWFDIVSADSCERLERCRDLDHTSTRDLASLDRSTDLVLVDSRLVADAP